MATDGEENGWVDECDNSQSTDGYTLWCHTNSKYRFYCHTLKQSADGPGLMSLVSAFFFFFQCSPPTIYLLFWISELCVKAKGFSVTFNVSKFPSVTQNETVATFSELSCTSGSYQLWLNRFVGGGRSEIGLWENSWRQHFLLTAAYSEHYSPTLHSHLLRVTWKKSLALARKTSISLCDCATEWKRTAFWADCWKQWYGHGE